MTHEFHYSWTYHLRNAPADLWPYVADTNRFNQDTGLKPVQRLPQTREESANAHRRLMFRTFGIAVQWTEEPFEWVEPRRFGVVRRYERGPVAEMRVLAEMSHEADGTALTYQVWARPKNPLGFLAIPVQIGIVAAKDFRRVFHGYDDRIDAERSPADKPARSTFQRGGIQRLGTMRSQLIEAGGDEALTGMLSKALVERPDMALAHIRPYALADEWDVPRRNVLDLCLLATRVGMLDMRWDILCPLCRGPKQMARNLGGIMPRVHCDTCNIDFDTNFDQSVEVTFRPSRTIRYIGPTDYCIAGPRVTPHVVAQQLLEPGEERPIDPELEEGRHRIRTLSQAGGRYVDAEAGAVEEAALIARPGGWNEDPVEVGRSPRLTLRNTTDEQQLFILERMKWMDDAATAAEVTVLQRYRDLFSREALRPGERISVGSLAILFTDLCESTRIYREIGDAPAFGLVMDHFEVLRDAITRENGGIVKTIGDAVMAVFREPSAALRAVLDVQHTFATQETDGPRLSIKAGLHYGPCIAVTLNERLDYFGSTVNIASRLEHLSEGGVTVISQPVFEDPEVAPLLEQQACSTVTVEPFSASLKGFDTPFSLHRVSRK